VYWLSRRFVSVPHSEVEVAHVRLFEQNGQESMLKSRNRAILPKSLHVDPAVRSVCKLDDMARIDELEAELHASILHDELLALPGGIWPWVPPIAG
jgi:hypothetical protein